MTWRSGRYRLAMLAVLLGAVAVGSVGRTDPVGADGNEAPGAPVGARSITAGRGHTCAILDDATVKCWGLGSNGALGQDNTLNVGHQPGGVAAVDAVNLGPGRAATAITAGGWHTCAILDNGSVKCWGQGLYGVLGQDKTTTIGGQPGDMAALNPIDLGAGRTATAITAGDNHTCAILDNATVKCWGRGLLGVLGQGNSDNVGDQPGDMAALNPIDLGAGRTATAISAGGDNTCAILDNATVKCWGSNSYGELGHASGGLGSQPGDIAAVDPVDLGAGRTATAITTGGDHTCAILDNATVKCWGKGDGGQLGQDSTAHLGDQPGEMAALDAVDLGAGRTATAITTGTGFTCAILDDATVKCWGQGGAGQLGQDSTATLGDQPGEMAALDAVDLGAGRTATAITVGSAHTCAILDGGSVKCWGYGLFGMLGQGNTTWIGDQPGEMAALAPVDLGAGLTAGPGQVAVAVTADQASVVAGQVIDYHVTVINTGDQPLSEVQVLAPDVPDCAQVIGDLAVGAVSSAPCQHPTSPGDDPLMINQVQVTAAEDISAFSGPRRTRVDPQVFRPDAHIRRAAGAFAGNGIYNLTGANQTRTATVGNLGTATFTVRIQNDGNTVEDFTVKGLGATTRFTVIYKRGTTTITAAVVAGTYTVNDLAPGATHDLTLTIRARARIPVGATITRRTTITSATSAATKDAIASTVTRR